MIDGKPIKKIHRDLYDATISKDVKYMDKYLLGVAIKTANKAKKIETDLDALIVLFMEQSKIGKKVINHEVGKEAEKEKIEKLDTFIDKSRDKEERFYLASSHDDCAKDHKERQGRLYVDEKAPDDVIKYAKSRNLYTLQRVIGKPVWFITRPNCRHYFVSLNLGQVDGKSLKKLKRKYKTHVKEGDRDFQTPRKIAIEEYEDRLKMLEALYREYQTPKLKAEIQKTRLLLRKWKEK